MLTEFLCAGATGALLLLAGQPTFAQGETPLIPREVLFGNPDRAAVKVSPDAKHLSFLAPLDGVLNVWVAPVAAPDEARAITSDRGRGIRMHTWAMDGEHILYLQDKDGDEDWHVYSAKLADLSVRDLTPFEGVSARVEGAGERYPKEVLIGINDRNKELHDVYRVNVETGERDLVVENPGFLGFVSDNDLQVRLAMRMKIDGSVEVLRPAGDEEWEHLEDIPFEDTETTSPVGFDKGNQTLYIVDSRSRNTGALYAMDMASGARTLVFEDPRADVSDLLVHPTDKTIQAVASTYERKQWQVLDQTVAADLEYLRTVARGDAEVTSRSLDDTLWTVAFIADNGPVSYYLYDRKARHAEFLFTNRKALEDYTLTKMYPVLVKSRDGLDLVSYLTLPPWLDRDGRPSRPVPLVLVVHGGPWYRDDWGYDPLSQLLANRGYATLAVNFRGSTGLGKDFVNAANGQWGAKMHDDLIDAVNWAIAEKIADPVKVAIFGGSYGGYATLVGLTATPEVFACGVDLVGPSDLVTFIETVPAYWQPMIQMLKTRIGDYSTDEGRALLQERSPLSHVDRIARPLLIGQGANDPRVNKAESDQIVAAMQAKGIPVTYLLYPDEGHGFARPENSLSFFTAAEIFLSQHLGGRCEPIGNSLEGSSMQVLAGAEGVPGLAEAPGKTQGQ